MVSPTIAELLTRAKAAIEAGETSLRAAADDLAAAQKRGATQRQIAEAVGKSAAWVNRLLKWRETGYHGATPFGPQSKASRRRAHGVQATKQQSRKIPAHSRKRLVKYLGMLGSSYDGERANAASFADKQRAELRMSWDELVIPAK